MTEWKGFVELLPRRYLRDRGSEGRTDNQLIVLGEAELDFRLGGEVTGYFRPRLYADLGTEGFERLYVPELFLTYSPGRWDLRGGVLVENWGIADTFNPIDFLNPRDFATKILDPLKLGQPGVRLRRLFEGGHHFGEPTLTLYWMPTFERTRYAPRGQRFHPAPVGFSFTETGIDPRGSDRTLWALRYQSTLDTPLFNSDIQLLASRGPDRSPPIHLIADGILAPVYQDVQTTGFGLRAVPNEARLGHFLSTFTLKAEVAHRSFARYGHSPFEESDDYWTCVVGFDRQLPNLLSDRDLLTLTLEYVSESGADDAPSSQRVFQQDLIFRALWQANNFSRSTVQLRGVVDPQDDETILEASFTTQLRAVSEDLRLELRYQRFEHEGEAGTFLSRFSDNSSVSIGLRWDFAN
ncbi:MAG: hypothetical protein O6758_05450 [Planctomycetota bacterium]|nr:hypothetical protein [Planctomycetota bacterium]